MWQTRHVQQAVFLAAVLTGVMGVSCRSRSIDQGTDPSPALWLAEQPLVIEDDSLTGDFYRKAGVAAEDRNWNSSDMVEAAAQLNVLLNSGPGRLPRSGSIKSGVLFGRMTSANNLTALRDPSLPIAIRLPAAVEFMHGLDALFKLYLAEMHEQRASGTDIVELDGARLRTIEVVLDLLEASLAVNHRDEALHANQLAAYDRIREGLSDVLGAILRSITDPRQFGVSARRRLVDYCRASLPGILPRLKVKARGELLGLIDQQSHDPHLENLRQALSQLRESVATSVIAPESAE